jgi:hypothetical protein
MLAENPMILLSVHCASSDEVKRAKEIIERTGGATVCFVKR